MGADVSGPGATGSVFGGTIDLEPYMDRLAFKIADELERRRGRMVNQAESELGRRRHREAVTRRLANNEGGAGISGRNFLLTREAVREELASGGGRPKRGRGSSPSPAPSPSNDSSPSSGAQATPQKSRARDLGDWQKDLISGLNAVGKRPRR